MEQRAGFEKSELPRVLHSRDGACVAVKINILLASDYGLTRSGLRRIMSAHPDLHVVAEVDAIARLAELYSEGIANIILIDVMVSGPYGLRAVAQLLAATPGARVVVVCTNENLAYARSMFSLGALGYVLRKASDKELFEAIRSVH